jgi:peptidoglycan-associated lipoprotein
MRLRYFATFVVVLALVGACAKKQPPVARPTTPPPGVGGVLDPGATRPPAPPEPVPEPMVIPEDPSLTSGELAARSLDEINDPAQSPFQPVFFLYDSDRIEGAGQAALQSNAQILRQYPSWILTIEGHCDERGTPEYNLALGERRALAARDYLVSLGIAPDRLKTVSYGNEFPFDPGRTEEAYSKNRRAHFVVTAK